MLTWLRALWDFVWYSVIRVLWLCGYATIAVVLVVFLFIFNDQGQDLLRLSAERGWSVWNLMFLLAAPVLGLVLWYTSRLLLGRNFEGAGIPWSRNKVGRVWWPRLFGTAVPAAIGIGFLRVPTAAQTTATVMGVLFLLIAAALLYFLVIRRRLFARGSRLRLDDPAFALDALNWTLIIGSFVVSLALLLAFVTWPVTLPRIIGAPAIVLLALAGVALVGGLVLTYGLLVHGQSGGTAFALVLALIFGIWNDNHWVRLAPDAPPPERQAAYDHYRDWRRVNPPYKPVDQREPVILVAAAGGGIRAAYWTASALATMEQVPGFDQSLFAVSGVSGGSVGAATYVGLKRKAMDGGAIVTKPSRCEEPPPDTPAVAAVRTALGQDFLSPVVAGMLFPDLAQRFFPVPFAAADRQRFLELGFERALGPGANPLGAAFTGLYAGDYRYRLPSLLLNTTAVESGRRAILSNITPAGFTDTVDLLADGYSTQAVRLSAAAGASARFTYVSPAGSLTAPNLAGPGETRMRLVDGGYFENSGAATIADLLFQLVAGAPQVTDTAVIQEPDAASAAADIFPILILIRNDPKAPPVCQRPPTSGAMPLPTPRGHPSNELVSEIASPLLALLNARTARGRLAEVDAAKAVEQMDGAVIELSLAAVVQAELERVPAEQRAARLKQLQEEWVEPPLGWSLSQEVRCAMDEVMATRSGGLALELQNLKVALDGSFPTGYVRCDAR